MNRTPDRRWDFPSIAFLILILLTASQRLYATHWAWELGSAIILTLLAVVLGLALGYSKFGRGAVFWLSFGYSIPIVLLVLCWFLYAGIPWLVRLADLSNRLAGAFGLFFMGKPVPDTILFVVFMALVFWTIGLMAGFAMTRFGNFVGAVVPAGVVLVIVQLYDTVKGHSQTALAIYIFLSLLVLGRLTYVQRRTFWKERRIMLLGESKTDLNLTLAVVTLLTVMVVWWAPTSLQSFADARAAWDKFTRPLQDIQENLGHAVAGVQKSPPANTLHYFGAVLALGSRAATGAAAILNVQAPAANPNGRYYWQTQSYNLFLDDQWYAENVSSTLFTANLAPISLAQPEGPTGEFDFTVVSPDLGELVTPARPVWVDYPAQLFFIHVPPGKIDPVQFRSNSPASAGEKYIVRANLYQPTVLQLRNAGATYPDWVTAHYLQLPDNLSPEITALAQRITARINTPYDMATAITKYLRSNITYSNIVNAPPAGQDPLDWFLFDSKKGFCNYYATAEVVLLRSAGIPARLVVGFAQGESTASNTYVVRQRDAHAWPEAYFPGVGWVEFEPTVNQQPLARPLGETTGAGQAGTPTPTLQNGAGQEPPPPGVEIGAGLLPVAMTNWIMRLFLILIFISTILRITSHEARNSPLESDQGAVRMSLPGFLKRFFENRGSSPPAWLKRWAHLVELNPIERSFATIYTSLGWLGQKSPVSQTPAEAATALAERLPQVSTEIQALLSEYQRHLYSPLHGYLPLARRAEKVIRKQALRVAIQQRWLVFRSILKIG
jgi:transglutaminase-like putative cysteine protease